MQGHKLLKHVRSGCAKSPGISEVFTILKQYLKDKKNEVV